MLKVDKPGRCWGPHSWRRRCRSGEPVGPSSSGGAATGAPSRCARARWLSGQSPTTTPGNRTDYNWLLINLQISGKRYLLCVSHCEEVNPYFGSTNLEIKLVPINNFSNYCGWVWVTFYSNVTFKGSKYHHKLHYNRFSWLFHGNKNKLPGPRFESRHRLRRFSQSINLL